MIKIQVTEMGIRMNGHAGHFQNGRDIVCAAVSALTCNLINSLQDLAGEELVKNECNSGHAEIQWEKLSEKGKLLVDSWLLGISAINQNYGCIEFI